MFFRINTFLILEGTFFKKALTKITFRGYVQEHIYFIRLIYDFFWNKNTLEDSAM